MLASVSCVKVEPAFASVHLEVTLCKSGSSLLPRFTGFSHCARGLAASPGMSTEQVPRDANKAIKDGEYK